MSNFCIIYLFFIILKSVISSNLECDNIETNDRFDCYPERDGLTREECERRGCCWVSQLNISDSNPPNCFFPKNFPNYKVSSLESQNNEKVVHLEKQAPTFRPNEILKLKAKIRFETKQRVRIQITDENKERFQVPINNEDYSTDTNISEDETDYQVSINENPFSIKIYRKSTGKIVFDSSIAPLIYADQFIQFSTKLASNIFYGLGERQDTLAHRAEWKRFTLWNRDIGTDVNLNLYGSHPFSMTMDKDGNAVGFFFMNSNAMDVKVNPTPALTFITIGGIIDFFVYLGPSPAEVIFQHTEVVGKSQMPQYFTMGFQISRWGYSSSDEIAEVIRRNRAIGIPYDVQWSDIDAMEEKADWTYDKNKFASLPEIVKDLHEHGQYYINIIDPGIANKTGYYSYESGLEKNVFIKYHNSTEPLVGVVWPGTTVYPDFTHPNATSWWADQAKRFHEEIEFDGLWIDMNEPSNFYNGSINGCPGTTHDNPPYMPKVLDNSLLSKTICPSAEQYLSIHYNLHNLYGHYKSIITNKALRLLDNKKRPFVLTRSSFSGTGHFAAHWSGDNRAIWEDLYYSIPFILSFNMFGISQVGADVCGFFGHTNEELCVRWTQLGSFYPFMRNHNSIGAVEQDPAAFSKSAQDIMIKAVKVRYALLPYFYGLFYRSNQFGDTVVRPLFFEYPNDEETYEIDRQFMVGPGLLITPVLEQGATSVEGYFPDDEWYQSGTGLKLDLSKGRKIRLDAPLSEINYHVRGGHIIPYQEPGNTTTQSRKNPFGLVVALKQNKTEKYANGFLFWDDGESIDSIDKKHYNYFEFNANHNGLIINKLLNGYKTKMILNNMIVLGVDNPIKEVIINGKSHDKFTYNNESKYIEITSIDVDMLAKDSVNVSWS